MPVGTIELPLQMIDAAEMYAAREHLTVCDLFAQMLCSRYGYELKVAVSEPTQRKRHVNVPDSVKAISGIVSMPSGMSESDIVREAVMSN